MNFIHRPGLSFDYTTPEFGICLSACLGSGNAILSLVESLQIPRWLRNLSLIGPATIFKSPLVQVYSQLKYRTFKLDGFPALDTSMGVVSKGISILTSEIHSFLAVQGGKSFYCESLNEVIETLQTLLSSMPASPCQVYLPQITGFGMPTCLFR
jgi:hypothetical protein